jgi:hypothetical protein
MHGQPNIKKKKLTLLLKSGLKICFFCRIIDAFIEADRKGYKIHVSNDREYVTIDIPYPVIKLRI